MDDADRQPALVVVVARLQLRVVQGDRAGADAFDPKVGVLDAELTGPREGGVGEGLQGKCGERGVDRSAHVAPSAVGSSTTLPVVAPPPASAPLGPAGAR